MATARVRTRVKVCGITRIADAAAAAQAGAEAIGLVFYPPSPRFLSAERAREIRDALPPFVQTVALFVNADAALVAQVIGRVHPAMLQFHGEETPDECDLVMERGSEGTIEQTFYARRGVMKTRVRSTASGQFISASSVHWASMASLVLPFLAFIPFMAAIVHKMTRTRSFFTWQMARHPWDALERMLLLYSVPLMLAGIVAPWLKA